MKFLFRLFRRSPELPAGPVMEMQRLLGHAICENQRLIFNLAQIQSVINKRLLLHSNLTLEARQEIVHQLSAAETILDHSEAALLEFQRAIENVPVP